MQTYDDLVRLARICIRQAKEAKHEGVASQLRQLAREYQRRAAELDGGKPPIIDDV